MKQHTVPRSYLARWCDPSTPAGQEPYIWIFAKEKRQGKKRAPHKAFRKTHFYTDKRPSAADRLWLEKGLGKVEGGLAAVTDRVVTQGIPLSVDNKGAIAAFAATMFVRTPQYEQHIRSQWEPVLALGNEMVARAKEMTPQQLKTFSSPISGSGPSLSMEQVEQIVEHPLQSSIKGLMAGMLRVLMLMKCRILYTANAPGFITSDAPCVVFDPDWWKMPPMYRGGLASRTVEVTVPLSPNFAALFAWQLDNDLHYLEVPDAAVDEVNRQTRFSCDKQFVVCQNETRDHWFDPGQPPPGIEMTT